MSARSRSPITSVQLVFALIAIVVVTAIVPSMAASWLNRRRVFQTLDRATRTWHRIAPDMSSAYAGANGATVVCGPGKLPRAANTAAAGWLQSAVIVPRAFGDGMPTDLWGQCFLMNIGDWQKGARVWVLSAGPNGVIDTPFGAPELAGDDVGDFIR